MWLSTGRTRTPSIVTGHFSSKNAAMAASSLTM